MRETHRTNASIRRLPVKIIGLFGLIFLLLSGPNPQAVEEAKVSVIGGVPRVVLDGVPTTLRPFRGGSNPSFFQFNNEPFELSEPFLCTEETAGKGTILFSFAIKPVNVKNWPVQFFLDDFVLTEETTGQTLTGPCEFNDPDSIKSDWNMFSNKKNEPVGSLCYSPDQGKNGSGCLLFQMNKPSDDLWPQHLLFEHKHNLDLKKGKTYRLTCHCRATSEIRVGINAYLPGNPYVPAGSPKNYRNDPLSVQAKLAHQCGFNQYVLSKELSWPRPGENYDFSSIDREIDLVLKIDPNALFIFWFGCDPPVWWLDDNKDHEEVLQGSSNTMQYKKRSAAISSPLYVKEACRHLKAAIEYLEKKYGQHIIGYQPCAQNTWEWFYQGVIGSNAFPGFAPIDRIEWNRWLEKKYKNSAELQKAWHSDRYRLGEIDVPSLDLRRQGQKEIFLDPVKDPAYFYLNDYNEFMQNAMSGAILEMAKTSKEACRFKKLVTFFYGYYFHFSAYGQGSAVTGHLDLEPLLDSPYIDGFAAPFAYGDRDRGGCPTQMTPAETMLLHNKIFIVEDDLRTWHVKNNPSQHPLTYLRDLSDTCQAHQRNTTAFITRNYECWYVDLGRNGWLNDKGIWQNLQMIQPIDRYFLNNPIPYRPEIAVFCGTKSLRTVANGLFTGETISQACWMFTRLGIPAGQYILADYLSGKTNAKVNILSAAWNLSAQDRKILREKVQTDTIVWAFASGWLDSKMGGSIKYMNETLPFKIKKIANPKKSLILTEHGKKAGLKTEYERNDYPCRTAHYMKPDQKKNVFNFDRIPEVFTVEDAKPEEILIRYSDGSPAMAIRSMPKGGCSIFLGFPAMSKEIVYLAARSANVPIYTEQAPVFFSNGRMIILHGSKEGSDNVRLHLPKSADLFDCFNNEDLGKGSNFDLKLDWGKTRVLLLDPSSELRRHFSGTAEK